MHFPAAYSNRKPKEIRGFNLHAQFYDLAIDLCRSIPNDVINSAQGAGAIFDVLYKHDPFSVVTSLFDDFSSLLATKRGVKGSFKNFESLFSASLSKYSSHAKSTSLPDIILVLMLLYKSDVFDSQRVAVLSAAASRVL